MRDLSALECFGAFMEFTDEEAEESKITGVCNQCHQVANLIVPKKEVKEKFRQELFTALPRGIPNFTPSLKHFWFFARCNMCHKEMVAMRS